MICPNGSYCVVNMCLSGLFETNTSTASTQSQVDTSTTSILTTPIIATTTILHAHCLDRSRTGYPSDCPQRAYLCNNPIYYNLMTQECPKTCNRCPGSGSSGGAICVDRVGSSGRSDCPMRIQLCMNNVYRDLMRNQCPKTCGFC